MISVSSTLEADQILHLKEVETLRSLLKTEEDKLLQVQKENNAISRYETPTSMMIIYIYVDILYQSIIYIIYNHLYHSINDRMLEETKHLHQKKIENFEKEADENTATIAKQDEELEVLMKQNKLLSTVSKTLKSKPKAEIDEVDESGSIIR